MGFEHVRIEKKFTISHVYRDWLNDMGFHGAARYELTADYEIDKGKAKPNPCVYLTVTDCTRQISLDFSGNTENDGTVENNIKKAQRLISALNLVILHLKNEVEGEQVSFATTT